MQKRIVKETLTDGTVQYRVEKFAKPVFFLKRRWITDTVYWDDPLGDPFMDIEIDAVFDTLEEAEAYISFSEMPNVIKREIVKTNNEREELC